MKSPAEKRTSAVTNSQATRETVESVVIAVILAFLFRGFVAEAFVIPTGSMAPTLMGRHMDVTCPQCQYSYRTGATEENDRYRGVVETTFCPMCRFPLQLDRVRNPNQRSFTGDRILVSKFAYELEDPQRWDVIVFKYPGNAKQNYIKRLVGLPKELVRIRHGDIFVAQKLFELELDKAKLDALPDEQLADFFRQQFQQAGRPLGNNATFDLVSRSDFPETVSDQSTEAAWVVTDRAAEQRYFLRVPRYEDRAVVYSDFAIARKPVEKSDALLQTVFDTRHRGENLVELGWPARWREEGAAPVWREQPDGSLTVDSATSELAWLRYRHIYPSENEWSHILSTQRLPDQITRPQGELISDYYTYNDRNTTALDNGRQAGIHWVGDLSLECEVTIGGQAGQVALDLVEGGVHFRCTIDVASGQAVLSNTGDLSFTPQPAATRTASTSVRGGGQYRLRFDNVDDELRLFVDGKLVAFDGPTTYQTRSNVEPKWSTTDPGDLAPAGVGVQGTKLDVAWIDLRRDVYYLAIVTSGMSDYENSFSESVIQDIFRSPENWDTTILFQNRRTVEFAIPDDCFFPLGDNSPQSMDGRLWGSETYFEKDLLIGKAMLVYWPHAWRRPIPFLPNFSRMGVIR